MADKFSVVGSSESFRTFKALAWSAARVKGQPEILDNLLVFPFDDYAVDTDQILVFEADCVEVTAPSAGALLGDDEFVIGDYLFWNATTSEVTNTNALGAHRFIGRALESKDLSGGTAAGDTLLMSLEQPRNLRVHGGTGTLDASNPTPVAHGMTVCISLTATLKKTTAPGVGTAVLTASISSGNVNVYAWKPTGAGDTTLIASTGTEEFYWVAVGY